MKHLWVLFVILMLSCNSDAERAPDNIAYLLQEDLQLGPGEMRDILNSCDFIAGDSVAIFETVSEPEFVLDCELDDPPFREHYSIETKLLDSIAGDFDGPLLVQTNLPTHLASGRVYLGSVLEHQQQQISINLIEIEAMTEPKVDADYVFNQLPNQKGELIRQIRGARDSPTEVCDSSEIPTEQQIEDFRRYFTMRDDDICEEPRINTDVNNTPN